MTNDNRPIGLFDSGLGGLTVLKSLADAFPQESFLYVGDVARLPYGNKSPETVRKYGEQILRFLKERDVKMLIIACNTASTVFLNDTQFEGLPLFNVIEPGSKAALAASSSKRIGVIGTSTTVQGHAYQRTIQSLEAKAQVWEEACPLFVPLAEEGMVNDEVTKLMAQRYLAPLKTAQVDTLVLGCTHYPLLKPDIAQVMGDKVKLIESGQVLVEILRAHFVQGGAAKRALGSLKICTTDVTSHFARLARGLMGSRDFGELERIVL